MKIDLSRTLDLPLSGAQAWSLLERIETVASCLPGAKITERVDASRYKGMVTVKLGPATVNFKGELEVLAMDPATHHIHVAGRGTDGASSAATLELTADLTGTGVESSRITASSEVSVSGKVASFGGRLMNAAADQLIGQFYANLLKQAEAVKIDQAALWTPETPVADKLNGLALLWAIVRDFLRSLFARRRTT
jgi:hypothetical protein